MRLDQPIRTARLQLRALSATDATDRYLRWMLDPQVVRYLEPGNYSLDSLRQYIEKKNASADDLFLGIFLLDGMHIGNIRLGPINHEHGHSAIGVLIGERDMWNQGYASEAVVGVTSYAFRVLALEKLFAGFCASNLGSQRVFLKAGYVEEARLKDYWKFEGRRAAQILVGIVRADWIARQHQLAQSTTGFSKGVRNA